MSLDSGDEGPSEPRGGEEQLRAIRANHRMCVEIQDKLIAAEAIGADLTNAIGIATLAALFATSIAARLAVLAEVDCNL